MAQNFRLLKSPCHSLMEGLAAELLDPFAGPPGRFLDRLLLLRQAKINRG